MDYPGHAASLGNMALLQTAEGREAEDFKLIKEEAEIDHRMIGQILG